jgi:AraC-like DNA-binding protein
MLSNKKNKDLILVVGETTTVFFHLHEVLVTEYNVIETSNSAEGLNQARVLLPQLVIRIIGGVDMEYPSWCKDFKSDNDTGLIPLLLLYCEGSEDCIIKGFECGVEDCIAWPFNVNILKARVKSLVENRRQLLEKVRVWALLRSAQPGVIPTDSEFVEQLHVIIEKNLSNPLFSVAKLCKKLELSRATMYRKIQALTGESPQLFIRSFRLQRAAHLLENNYGNVTEVCFHVGFNSTAYFTKCFKEKFGCAPKVFARANGLVNCRLT